MRKFTLFLLAICMGLLSQAQVAVSGATGGNGSYATLSAAFAGITSTAGDNIVITISGNTTEPATGATLNAGSWTSLTIAPSGGPWTVSGAVTAGNPLIIFNGADNVTVNGMDNLTFTNTTASGNTGTSTLKLVADATNNIFNNVSFKGSPTGTAGSNASVVWISTGTTTGNDNNQFQSCKFLPAGATLPGQYIVSNGSITSKAIQNSGIVINNCEFSDYFLASGTQAAIYVSSGSTDWTISNNKIFQTSARTIATASTVYGIYCSNTGATATGESFFISNNTIGFANNAGTGTTTYNAGTTAGGFTGIFFNATGNVVNTHNINNNLISNIEWTSTGASAFYGISTTSITSTTVGFVLNQNANQIKNINWVSATGQVTGILSGYSPATNIKNNIIDNISRSGSGAFYGINYTGTSSTAVTLDLNTVSNLSFNHSTSTSALYGMYSVSSPAIETITNNTVSGLVSQSTGGQALKGVYNSTSTSGNKTVQNNTVSNLSLPASGTGTIYGIQAAYQGASNQISGNTVHDLSGGATVYGILAGSTFATGAATQVHRNKIYNLSTDKTNGKVIGLTAGTGTNTITNIYNNLIGDLSSVSTSSTIDAVRGIELTGTTAGSSYNVAYNTVYLSGAASSGTDFATSAFYHTANATATAAQLTLKNNLFVNDYPSAGAGISAVYKRSSVALDNYNTASNKNNFYGTNIFYDGTNTDANIGDFKNRVSPREAQSFSENPDFASTTGADANYLSLNAATPTQMESGGENFNGITTDFNGTVRQGNTGYGGAGTAPDVGAWEFEGIAVDLTPPTISYVPLTNAAAGSTQVLSATITDASGVPTSGVGLPVLYYSINGGAYTAVTATSLGGDHYSFSFGSAATNVNDSVSYYIVAQDMAPTPNVGASPAVGAGGFTANPPAAATPPTSPSYYKTVGSISGTKTVGTGGDFTTLTGVGGAFETINNNVVTGNIELQIISDITEPGTVALNQLAGSGGYTIKIYPTGAPRTLTGNLASAALIKLNGADRVTIDGSLNGAGTDRSLSISNTATSAPSVISLVSLGLNAGATNNTIKNLNISTPSATTLGYGISVGGNTPGTSGADNDDITISNNAISGAGVGIYASGTTDASAGANNNLYILKNNVTYSGNAACYGIRVGYSLSSLVGENVVSQQTSGDFAPVGISIETGFLSSQVVGNTIAKSLVTATGGYGGRGITVGTGSTSSNLTIANNVIYGVNGSNWSSFSNSSSMGIAIGVVGNSTTLTTVTGGINLYHNSIRMSGAIGTGSTSGITTAVYVGTGASALDIRNNIFASTQTGSGSQKNYAIYSAATTNAAFSEMDNNVYFVNGTQGVLGYISSTARTMLAEIQTGFGKNSNSHVTDPQFVSETDLHINSGATVTPLESGGANVGISTDMDGDARPGPAGSVNGGGTAPDIGADEFDGVPLSPCVTPTAQPTALVLNASGQTTVSGTFTAASPAPSGYLVVRTTSSSLAALPVDGTSYSVGANTYFGTDGYVQSVSNSTTINATGLTSGTTYYFWVISYNTGACTGGPKYLTTSPLSGSATTGALFTSVATGNWEDGSTWDKGTAPSSGDDVVIAATHTVTVNAAAAYASNLAVNANGTLAISGTTLTINGVSAGGFNNSGTVTITGGHVILGTGAGNFDRRFATTSTGNLNISAGLLQINGNVVINGKLNQSGGIISIDGNNGGIAGGSVASGVSLLNIAPAANTDISLTGGKIILVDPHYSTTTSLNVNAPNVGAIVASGTHLFQFGDGVSTDNGGTNGFFVYNWAGTGIMVFNDVELAKGVGGTNRFVYVSGTYYVFSVAGNLTIREGAEFRHMNSVANTNVLSIGGNLINDGTLTSTGAIYLGNTISSSSTALVFNPTASSQTISGIGTYRNALSSTASFTAFTINNNSAGGVTFGSGITNPSFSGTVTVTDGTVNASGISMNGSASSIALTAATSIINVETFTNNSTAATVTLSGSGKLNVSSAVSFGNINSKTLAAGGRLVLKSSASGTARIADLTNGGINSGNKITGNVSVERYIPGGRRAYRFFGHPFTAAIPLNQLMVVSGANTGIDITGTGGAANGFTPTNTNASSAYNYTPATGNDAIAVDPGWNAYANTTAALWQPKEGARILIRGTKGEGLDGAPYTPSATTISMSGALNDGSTPVFNLTAGANSEYNFIANPLASQIDMRAVVIGGTVNSNYYVWDVNSAARGAYFNEPFTSAVTYRYLPIGSAFFARTSSSGTIGFPENVKVSNTPATVLKGTSAYGANSIQLVLRDAANIKHDRILFFIDNTASSSLDTKDGEKFTNPGINFYAMSTDNKKLSIDARPFADNTVIPLGLYNVETGGSYVLAADDFNVDDDKDVMLHDKKLNSFTAFTVGMEYPFSVNLADSSSFGNRFELVMKAGTTLPLSELNLVATKQPAGVLISFTTTNETDLARHEVERSLNGKDFEGKTTLAAKNEKFNSYSWTDADVNAATIFYRIKTTAKSGAVSYSRVVKLLLNGRSEVSVYPNPVTGRSVQLQFSNMDKGSYQVKLYGANGQVVMSSTMTHNGGSTVQPLALPHLASGVYNLVLNEGNHRFMTTLIVE